MPDTDEVPSLYNLHVQWCMEILDLPLAHVFVGFGRDFKDELGAHQFLYEETARYLVPRDRALAATDGDALCQKLAHAIGESVRNSVRGAFERAARYLQEARAVPLDADVTCGHWEDMAATREEWASKLREMGDR